MQSFVKYDCVNVLKPKTVKSRSRSWQMAALSSVDQRRRAAVAAAFKFGYGTSAKAASVVSQRAWTIVVMSVMVFCSCV